jgi:hypothetical protein
LLDLSSKQINLDEAESKRPSHREFTVVPSLTPPPSDKVLELCDAFHRLNALRLEIDRSIAALPPDDPGRDRLWEELEANLASLGDVVDQLARAPVTDLMQVRAKATVLSALLQSPDPDGTAGIPDDKRAALSLALAEDVIRSLGG